MVPIAFPSLASPCLFLLSLSSTYSYLNQLLQFSLSFQSFVMPHLIPADRKPYRDSMFKSNLLKLTKNWRLSFALSLIVSDTDSGFLTFSSYKG